MDYVKVVLEALLIWIVVFVVFTLIAEKAKKRKKYKGDWVSKVNYDKSLRTGDRNYLWDDNYKGDP